MSFSFRAGGVRIGGRRPGIAAPTGRTERNVRQRRLRTSENEAEAQQRSGATVRPARSQRSQGMAASGHRPEEAARMDITTVNDRHLYRGRVVLRDPADPGGQVELPERIVRFGPDGWLTVVDGLDDDVDIELYPTGRVLAVTELREVGDRRPSPAQRIGHP